MPKKIVQFFAAPSSFSSCVLRDDFSCCKSFGRYFFTEINHRMSFCPRFMQRTAAIPVFSSSRRTCPDTTAPGPLLTGPTVRLWHHTDNS